MGTLRKYLKILEGKEWIKSEVSQEEGNKRKIFLKLPDFSKTPMSMVTNKQEQRGMSTNMNKQEQRYVHSPEQKIPNNKIDTNNKDNNIVHSLVNYFFELKGWANKDKDFYKKKKIIYGRFTSSSKQLLYLCDDDLHEAKSCLNKIKGWADTRSLGWSIETVFKKWYELDLLKPKEKKPYWRGQRVFEINGKKYVLTHNGRKIRIQWFSRRA